MSKYINRIYNPYSRPSLKEKYDKLKEMEKLVKSHPRKNSAEPVRQPLSKQISSGTKEQHWKQKKKRDYTSIYILPLRIRHYKRKTTPSKYTKRSISSRSKY